MTRPFAWLAFVCLPLWALGFIAASILTRLA